MCIYKKTIGGSISKVDNQYYIIKGKLLFEVNEMGARIFDLCNGKNDLEFIISTLNNCFEVDRIEIEEDIKNYINILIEDELIKIK